MHLVLGLLTVLMMNSAAATNSLAGTVRFSNCSGFLFTVEGRSPEKNALVMTNGHCLDPLGLSMLAPNEVRINRSSSRNILLIGDRVQVKVTTKRLLYATMTLTDMAIYELPQSYAYLSTKYAITPLLLANSAPTSGTPVLVRSAYKKRTYECVIEEVLHGLREGGRSFSASLRFDAACGTKNGTSGSPVTLADGVTVVGINNTRNNSGKMCGNNNPCEVREDGSTSVIRNRSYGQQTALVYDCLNSEMDLDLNVETCRLPK